MSKYLQIINKLDDLKAIYKVIEHQTAITSREAEVVTGHSADIGAKSIVFKVGGEFLLVVVRGRSLVDFKKLRQVSGERKARLATPEEVQDVMGVKIGACYPFGSVAGVKMIVDETLANNEHISFSPGVHDKHIFMPWRDYVLAEQPTLVDIVKT